MNQENTELFFGDEQDVILTLEVEDGTEIKVTPLASFEIEELGTSMSLQLNWRTMRRRWPVRFRF